MELFQQRIKLHALIVLGNYMWGSQGHILINVTKLKFQKEDGLLLITFVFLLPNPIVIQNEFQYDGYSFIYN